MLKRWTCSCFGITSIQSKDLGHLEGRVNNHENHVNHQPLAEPGSKRISFEILRYPKNIQVHWSHKTSELSSNTRICKVLSFHVTTCDSLQPHWEVLVLRRGSSSIQDIYYMIQPMASVLEEEQSADGTKQDVDARSQKPGRAEIANVTSKEFGKRLYPGIIGNQNSTKRAPLSTQSMQRDLHTAACHLWAQKAHGIASANRPAARAWLMCCEWFHVWHDQTTWETQTNITDLECKKFL